MIIVIVILIVILIAIVIFIMIMIMIMIIIIRVMCMSGHFCNTRLFLNSSFSGLCSKNFEVMKLSATRHDEMNVDTHSFLILNVEKPKFLNGIFLVIIRIVCTNYSNTMIIVCTNYYFVSKTVYELCFESNLNDVLKERKMSLPQGEKKFECVYSYMMLKLIQTMV